MPRPSLPRSSGNPSAAIGDFQYSHMFPVLQPVLGTCQPQAGAHSSVQIKFLMKLATTPDGFASDSQYEVCIFPCKCLQSTGKIQTRFTLPATGELLPMMLPQQVSASVPRLVLLRQALMLSEHEKTQAIGNEARLADAWALQHEPFPVASSIIHTAQRLSGPACSSPHLASPRSPSSLT